MKFIVAGHEAVTASEFAELAFGIDRELFTGPAVESVKERRARLDVAREVLTELRELDPEAAAYAKALLRTGAFPAKPVKRRNRRAPVRPVHGCTSGAAVAA